MLQRILERTYFENTVWQWLLALGVAAIALGAALLIRRMVGRRYRQLAATSEYELMELPLEVLSRTSLFFLVVGALYLGSRTVVLPPKVAGVIMAALVVIGFWQLGLWATGALVAWFELKSKAGPTVDRAALGSLGIIGFILRAAVWTVVLLLMLDNLGVNITALVAGLGVGGIAVALAVQNVLGDLLASLSITLDRPFVVGDFVIVDDFLGTVEHIGVKSVRLRSLGGERIVMSNADLLRSRIRNYTQMRERRVVFSIRVAYDTPHEKLERIPGFIRSLIEQQDGVRFDRSHFATYGDFALGFETVYYVLSPDYNRYMDVQQAINLGIHAAFERDGIEFGYLAPTYWAGPGRLDGHASASS